MLVLGPGPAVALGSVSASTEAPYAQTRAQAVCAVEKFVQGPVILALGVWGGGLCDMVARVVTGDGVSCGLLQVSCVD